ncbi:MAG: hypothetical protein L0271_10335 [Gemmatimonadetes bacterium]|nr:hypothetical protein [Gemmatimonadota bacterium]
MPASQVERVDARGVVRCEVHSAVSPAFLAGGRVMPVAESGCGLEFIEVLNNRGRSRTTETRSLASREKSGRPSASTYAFAKTWAYSMMSEAVTRKPQRFSARATLAVPLNGSTAVPAPMPRVRSLRRMNSSSLVLLPM